MFDTMAPHVLADGLRRTALLVELHLPRRWLAPRGAGRARIGAGFARPRADGPGRRVRGGALRQARGTSGAAGVLRRRAVARARRRGPACTEARASVARGTHAFAASRDARERRVRLRQSRASDLDDTAARAQTRRALAPARSRGQNPRAHR